MLFRSDAMNHEVSITRTVNVSTAACSLGVPTNTIPGFAIYPNPVTDGKVYIETVSGDVKNIRMSDMSGKKVFSLNTADKELDLSRLPSGVYILNIEQDGKTATEKLIIN